MEAGVRLSDMTRVNCLLYADDVALIARNAAELQTLADEVTRWARQCKLKINAAKTEYLAIGARQNGSINLDGTMVQPNDDIKYLGYHKNRTDVGTHHAKRLEQAKKTLRNIQSVNRRLPRLAVKHKLHIIQACLDATYLYGIEVTSGTKCSKITAQADVVRRFALRDTLRLPRGVANEVIHIDAGLEYLDTTVRCRRIKLAQKVMNRHDYSLTKRVLRTAIDVNTEWVRQVREDAGESITNMYNRGEQHVRETIERLKKADRAAQMRRLHTK